MIKMKKKYLIPVILLVILALCAGAAHASGDLDNMSLEELQQLQEQLNQKISEKEKETSPESPTEAPPETAAVPITGLKIAAPKDPLGNGKELTLTKAYTYDPLHAMAYTFPRCASSTSVSFPTGLWSHYFTATASSASSTVVISVTDANGKTYTETMTRPKAFTVNDYKNK